MEFAQSHIALENIPRESIVLFLGVLTALATIAVLWKYRKSAEVRYLIYVEIFAGIWSLMYGIEFTKGQLKELIAGRQVLVSEPDQWPVALGYANWVEEIWTNYLTNAIKYGGTPLEVTVGAEPAFNGMVRFWIKDNGNGILPENQHKLFKKYIRLSPEKAEGYGLGLSIVKRIVEKLDGTAGAESSGNPGEGALFWFELPAV